LLPWLSKARVEIYLPPWFRANLRIGHSSGSLSGEADLLNYKTIDLQVSSGSVFLNRLSAETLSIRVSSGNMDVQGMGGKSFISVSSGRLQIGELTGGEHQIKSSSGRTRIGLIEGDTRFQVSSGGVAVEKILGKIEAQASSGSLSVEDFSGEGVFNISSGNIRLDIRELTGALRFEAASGTVEAYIPGGLSFNLDAVTRSGRVEVRDGPDEPFKVSGNSTVLRPFGPSPAQTIYVRTTSGNVIINRR
jgi:DUF4097 and DUF4098 domain-containing protein YvlB